MTQKRSACELWKSTPDALFTRSDFDRPTVEVARDLLGHLVIHVHPDDGLLVGRIVETEAYTEDDPACHAWGFRDASGAIRPGRGAALFGLPGTAYVYKNYGIHWLLNVVTEASGVAGAVLIRALEPLRGAEAMAARRPKARRPRDLTNGPGKLTEAMGIDGSHHGLPLVDVGTEPSPVGIARGAAVADTEVEATTRIGISRGVDRPWRFLVAGNPYVSPGRPSG